MELIDTKFINNPGTVIKILPGDQFIHSTVHLLKPTITLCLRTLVDGEYREQYGYYPTGIRFLGSAIPRLSFALLKIMHLEKCDIFSTDVGPLIKKFSPKEKLFCIIHLLNSTLDYKFIYTLIGFISVSDHCFAEYCTKLIKFYESNSHFNCHSALNYREQRIINMILNNCVTINARKYCLSALKTVEFSDTANNILSKILIS